MTPRNAADNCFAFIVVLLTVFGFTAFSPLISRAQQPDSARKVIERTATPYPPLARNMGLQGTVKLEVIVAPDGTVKEAQIKGGHPVLAQAAANAVRRWKWEPATHESRETVEIKFSPE
ncbi:MAG TPA: energy transducer TonB [Candidatus Sulfotelmatobacter sp.]|nr:energy transducer TonB [Candidatus Sulfotelmatobacter sp.]